MTEMMTTIMSYKMEVTGRKFENFGKLGWVIHGGVWSAYIQADFSDSGRNPLKITIVVVA